ncbi:MAG: hypothetical protein HY765_04020 [Rhodomicrobium sp.]|nr:hypothetical protein [Rhodomicrobium sp.]
MPNTPANGLPSSLSCQKSSGRLFSSAGTRNGVAALAILALLGAASYYPRNAAAAEQSQAQQAAQPGLPSFSSLVERVAPAVVSIRVKANPPAISTRDDEEEGESSGKENNPFEGTPLERFFQGPKGPLPQPDNSGKKAEPSLFPPTATSSPTIMSLKPR